MQYSITRLDLEVRAVFARPAFELPQLTPKVLGALYESMSPKHKLAPRDFESYGGTSYGDVLLVTKLFNGQGRIEVAADRLSGIFVNLITKEDDFAAIVDTYLLAEEGLAKIFTTNHIAMRRYMAHAWLTVDEGKDHALSMLRSRGEASFGWDNPRFSGLPKNYTVKADLRDGNDWASNFGLERSVALIADLYFNFEAVYDLQGVFPSVGQQIDHARGLFIDVLREFDLNPKTDTESS
jgi:hypothetical protein